MMMINTPIMIYYLLKIINYYFVVEDVINKIIIL